jgi:hypothetical protein
MMISIPSAWVGFSKRTFEERNETDEVITHGVSGKETLGRKGRPNSKGSR